MIFKDINCGFYTTHKDDLYVSSYEDVIANQLKNGIVERVICNMTKGGGSIHQMNNVTLKFAAASRGATLPLLHLLPPAYEQESYTKPELAALINNDQAMFRVAPASDASPFLDWMYDWMFAYLEESATPLFVSLQQAEMKELAETMQKHPNLKLFLTNTTQWLNRQYIQFLKRFPGVMLEISNVIEYYGIENITNLIGAERLFFGTYMPEKEPYDKLFQVLCCELSEEQKQLIAYGNYDRVIKGRN